MKANKPWYRGPCTCGAGPYHQPQCPCQIKYEAIKAERRERMRNTSVADLALAVARGTALAEQGWVQRSRKYRSVGRSYGDPRCVDLDELTFAAFRQAAGLRRPNMVTRAFSDTTAEPLPRRHPREEHIRRARAKKADLWARWLVIGPPYVKHTVDTWRVFIGWVANRNVEHWQTLADYSGLNAPSPETVRVIIYRLGDLAMRKIHT